MGQIISAKLFMQIILLWNIQCPSCLFPNKNLSFHFQPECFEYVPMYGEVRKFVPFFLMFPSLPEPLFGWTSAKLLELQFVLVKQVLMPLGKFLTPLLSFNCLQTWLCYKKQPIQKHILFLMLININIYKMKQIRVVDFHSRTHYFELNFFHFSVCFLVWEQSLSMQARVVLTLLLVYAGLTAHNWCSCLCLQMLGL